MNRKFTTSILNTVVFYQTYKYILYIRTYGGDSGGIWLTSGEQFLG